MSQMTSRPPNTGGSTGLPPYAMVVGAVSASLTGIPMSYGDAALHKPVVRGSPMTPQDQELIYAKVDAKMADMKGDLRLNTLGLAELKERFNDLSAKMASVPADIAGMKRDIAHLPGKGFVFTVGVGTVTGIGALLIALQRLGILH